MPDEIGILLVMAGVIVLLALIALIMFAPQAPSVPKEGPIRFAVKPFTDLEPDPQQLYLGDGIARAFVQALDRYQRFEAAVGDAPSRFQITGTIRKKGPRVMVQTLVSSEGRRYWTHAFDVEEENRAAGAAKAVDALAKKMKVALK
jgi:TolB-like protein